MIVIQANNFPKYTIAQGAEFEHLFLPPDGARTRYPIGWRGVGRYTAGSLRIWKNGVSLIPGTDFNEEANGVFFNFIQPPPISAEYLDYLISYVPRPDDLAFATGQTTGDEMFLFPNWLEATGIGDAFWIARHIASRADATSTAGGSSTTPTSKKGVVPWCNINFNDAKTYCAAKGTGWHLTLNREWCNIARWCKLMNIRPAGNSASGADGTESVGTPDPTVSGRTLTSAGPITWTHSGRADGIHDFIGNVWKWIDGLQLINGVLFIFNENNELISTGISPTFGTSGGSFGFLRTEPNLVNECIPATSGESIGANDGFWFNTSGTMGLLRGGNWGYGSLGGLFAFHVDSAPSYVDAGIGFRLCKSL